MLQRDRELCVQAQPENYVFANGAGRYYDPDDLRRRVLYPAMDKAGIERTVARAYGFHLFRHSAGSQMQEVTGDRTAIYTSYRMRRFKSGEWVCQQVSETNA